RLARVATGALDGTFAAPNSHDWDLAGADLLVHEAGGLVTTLTGESLIYNRPDPVHGALVAAGRARHALLLSLIRDRLAEFASSNRRGSRDAANRCRLLGRGVFEGEPGSNSPRLWFRSKGIEECKPMSDQVQRGQLLHLVFGGELTDLDHVEFRDLDKLDIVGIY